MSKLKMFLFQKQNFHFLDGRRKHLVISLITQTGRAIKNLL